MEQIYNPKIDTSAIPGYCLKYIDDAGNAPRRTATADYAYNVERNAGRIRTDTIPENVWVVGWLAFTSGMYQEYGHVFFIRRIGNSYEIHDSEVHSGSRRPYRSLDELLAWFGAYNPRYTGWSTHCDGREYAKKKEEKVEKLSMLGAEVLYRLYLGSDVTEYGKKNRVGKQTFDEAARDLANSEEFKKVRAKLAETQGGAFNHLPKKLQEVIKLPEQLKEK